MSLLDAAANVVGMGMDAFNVGSSIANTSYMKDQQRIQREREDNAVQRRVKDLQAAGLNPVLAAGSAASTSSPINVGTPSISGDNAFKAVQYGQARRQQALTDAQLELVHAQTDAADAASYVNRNFRDEMQRRKAEGIDSPFMPGMFSYVDAMARQQLAEADQADVNAKKDAYNAALAASAGVPVTGGSLDAIGTGKIIDNALKDPSSAASPLASILKVLISTFK